MSEISVINQAEQESLSLPPGFRFHPTDEEIVTHYLTPKALNRAYTCIVVGDVDLNKCEPWDLPNMAKMGEKEWYFFCHKDRKYPTGMRTNRATESGYWKATGKDKEIYRGKVTLVGMKKTLVFYRGRAPRGEKTCWVMHEYRLEGKMPSNLQRSAKDEWAVCRVFNKSFGVKNDQMPGTSDAAGICSLPRNDSFFNIDELLIMDELPPLEESTTPAVIDFKTPVQNAPQEFSSYYNNQVIKMEYTPQTSRSYNQFQMPPSSSPYYAFADTSNMEAVMMQALVGGDGAGASPAIRRYCKAEPYSSGQSMLSPSCDTGLSTDISSVLDDLSSNVDPVMTYTNIWKY